jgi:hypothetical protein
MKELIKITILTGIFFFSACVMDFQSDIAIIKNNTSSRLLIAKQPDEIMTDSTLYNERFSKTWIEANQTQFVILHNIKLSGQPDSVKTYLYVFNCDSVYKYQSLKKMKGIVQHTFIRKIEIQLNKVKVPLDTIYIK